MFSLVQKKSPGDWPRMLKYQCARPSGVQWAIAFRPLDEQFDAYVGWSRGKQSPFSALILVPNEDVMDTFVGDAIMLPTATIARRAGETFWAFWNPSDDVVNDPARFATEFANYYAKPLTETEARDLVHGPVMVAMAEIVTSCIPYLEKATG